MKKGLKERLGKKRNEGGASEQIRFFIFFIPVATDSPEGHRIPGNLVKTSRLCVYLLSLLGLSGGVPSAQVAGSPNPSRVNKKQEEKQKTIYSSGSVPSPASQTVQSMTCHHDVDISLNVSLTPS